MLLCIGVFPLSTECIRCMQSVQPIRAILFTLPIARVKWKLFTYWGRQYRAVVQHAVFLWFDKLSSLRLAQYCRSIRMRLHQVLIVASCVVCRRIRNAWRWRGTEIFKLPRIRGSSASRESFFFAVMTRSEHESVYANFVDVQGEDVD